MAGAAFAPPSPFRRALLDPPRSTSFGLHVSTAAQHDLRPRLLRGDVCGGDRRIYDGRLAAARRTLHGDHHHLRRGLWRSPTNHPPGAAAVYDRGDRDGLWRGDSCRCRFCANVDRGGNHSSTGSATHDQRHRAAKRPYDRLRLRADRANSGGRAGEVQALVCHRRRRCDENSRGGVARLSRAAGRRHGRTHVAASPYCQRG